VSTRRARSRFVTDALIVVVLAATSLLIDATPAFAHGVGGLQPSNFATHVHGIDPPIMGLSLRATDLGNRVELRNASAHDVIVLGYQNEPYLRVGPRGVFENERSPAVFLNRTSLIPTAAPPRFDPRAAPEWRHISSDPVARWHDHRSHWMGSSTPPVVQRSPHERHVLIANWVIPLRYENQDLRATGDVVWVPPASPWPWLALASVLALTVALLAGTRAWPSVLTVALAALVASEIVSVLGQWDGSTAGTGTKLSGTVYSLGGCLVGVVALRSLLRHHDPYDATPMALVAGVFLLIAGGFTGITTITRSQVPTTLPASIARLGVAIALGLGTGLTVGAARHLIRPRDTARPARRPTRARPRARRAPSRTRSIP
jgi:hypothetical protein